MSKQSEADTGVWYLQGCTSHTHTHNHTQVDELKKRSEDLKREAHTRKRQQEEHRRRLQELEVRQIDSSEKFNSLEEEVQVRVRVRVCVHLRFCESE